MVVFDVDTGERLDGLPDPDLRAAIVTPADQLFVGSIGGELTQYDLDTLEPIRILGGSRGHVFGGAGTADGSMLAINGGDRVAARYDVATDLQIGGPIQIWDLDPASWIRGACVVAGRNLTAEQWATHIGSSRRTGRRARTFRPAGRPAGARATQLVAAPRALTMPAPKNELGPLPP